MDYCLDIDVSPTRATLDIRTYDDEIVRLRGKRLGQHMEAERGVHRLV
jgi:hypothetical protein